MCVCVTPHTRATTLLFIMWPKKQNKSAKHCEWESSIVVDCSGAIYVVFMDSVYFFFCLRSGSLCGSMETVQDDAERKSSQHGFQRCILSLQTVRTRQEKKKNSSREPLGGVQAFGLKPLFGKKVCRVTRDKGASECCSDGSFPRVEVDFASPCSHRCMLKFIPTASQTRTTDRHCWEKTEISRSFECVRFLFFFGLLSSSLLFQKQNVKTGTGSY